MIDFDELNILSGSNAEIKRKAMPFKKYFGEMDIPDDEKEKRIAIAEELMDELLLLFALIDIQDRYGISDDYIKQTLTHSIEKIIQKYEEPDEYLEEYADFTADEVIRATQDHIEDEYYTSSDRAEFIAENEANTIGEYSRYKQAVKTGKTKKQWIDMKDNRERNSHLEVGGTVLPIDTPFVVGDSIMRFAKDLMYNPSPDEVINCRCSTRYF
jgi:uncharacterized protein with gpF-like domain